MERLTMSMAGEIENLEYEIQNTKARLVGLEMRLTELKDLVAKDKAKNAKQWPTDIDWND